MTQERQTYRAPALDKGLDILELLASSSGGLTRSDIVKALGRSQSEIYRMLERLVEREYVVRTSSRGDRFALSMKTFLLGSMYPPLKRMVDHALPPMQRFSAASQQSLHLVVPGRGKCLVVAETSPESVWEFRLPVGAQLDITNTSSGLVLLAMQNDEERSKLLTGIDPELLTPTLLESLENIRRDGYRVAPSGILIGVTDITAPVRGIDGNANAVLTCPYINRINHDENTQSVDKVAEKLIALADTLSFH